MKRRIITLLLLPLWMGGAAQSPRTSDLWFFQLEGPVQRIVLRGVQTLQVEFDKAGHIVRAEQFTHQGDQAKLQVTVHRNTEGRLDSLTTVQGRIDDRSNTSYRQRATDSRGNWIARKTQQKPYTIATEYCEIHYYEE